ncbi:MAG TPA: hypothetical protein VFN26_15425 [Candidatus Acidoferrum sp.]|nr:hypothetical protein [Candidatus Acidoferrum sp.]
MSVYLRFGLLLAMMIVTLSPSLAQTTQPDREWYFADQVLGVIQKAVATLAVIGGGAWGYFRFIRFRSFKPRLEFSFDWNESATCQPSRVGVLSLKLSNKGNTKVDLREEGIGLCMLKYALLQSRDDARTPLAVISRPEDDLRHLGRIFAPHKWIEPGETIDDVRAIQICDPNSLAVQFEVRIYGTNKWTASAAFPLAPRPTAAKVTSEDEQEEYEEAEKIRELIESSEHDAKSILSDLRARGHEEELTSIIQKAQAVVAKLRSIPVADDVIQEGRQLLTELRGVLGKIRQRR